MIIMIMIIISWLLHTYSNIVFLVLLFYFVQLSKVGAIIFQLLSAKRSFQLKVQQKMTRSLWDFMP